MTPQVLKWKQALQLEPRSKIKLTWEKTWLLAGQTLTSTLSVQLFSHCK